MDPKGFWSSYFKFCLLILLHLYQLLPKVSSSVLLLIDSAACSVFTRLSNGACHWVKRMVNSCSDCKVILKHSF